MSQASHLIFLVALAVFIVTVPFLGAVAGGQLVNTVLFTLVMLSGFTVLGVRRGTLLLAMALLVPGVVASWINSIDRSRCRPSYI